MKKKEMAKIAKKKVREQKVKNKLQKEREQLRAVRKHLEEDKPKKGITIYREPLLDELLEEMETKKNTAKEKLKHNALILQALEEEGRKTETE